MTTIVIEDSTPEGKWLIELIRSHKSVTAIHDMEKKDFEEAAAECGAVSVDEFIGEVKRQLKEYYNNA